MDTKSGSNILLPTRNTPQTERQTLPQSKGLGKDFFNQMDQRNQRVLQISNKIDLKQNQSKEIGKDTLYSFQDQFIKMKSQS